MKKLNSKYACFLSVFLLISFQSNATTQDSVNEHVLQQALTEPALREKLSNFIDNVLYQFPSRTFFILVDAINTNNVDSIYETLSNELSAIRPPLRPYSKLRALRRQQKILQKQALQLLTDRTTIRGCLEIGTPATYISTLQKELKFTGITYATLEQTHVTDIMQAYSYNPFRLFQAYDRYIPLADYEPISEDMIPSQSIDLVTCFVGLHHIPTEKLDAYIQSIQRVLRPGGILLLRDYDVDTPVMHAFVDAAHSVCNLIVNETPTIEDQREIRNFTSINTWIEILASHGFSTDNKRLVQDHDPTRNTMIRFEKQANTPEEQLVEQSNAITVPATDVHPQGDSFLPTPQWFAVDASREYGNFVNHNPFYKFPYFSYISTYWKLFGKSWLAASKRSGHLKTLTSKSTLFNTFIGLSTTIEYTAKGLISLPLRLMYHGQRQEPINMLIHAPQPEVLDNYHLHVIKAYDNHLYLVKAPRHKKFLSLATELSNTNVTITHISGQNDIQCKVRYPTSYTPEWTDCTCEYTWQLPTQPKYNYAAISTSVRNLLVLIKQLTDTKIELLHIHDF